MVWLLNIAAAPAPAKHRTNPGRTFDTVPATQCLEGTSRELPQLLVFSARGARRPARIARGNSCDADTIRRRARLAAPPAPP